MAFHLFADLVLSELEVVFIFGVSNVMSTKRQWMHRRNENTNFDGKIYELCLMIGHVTRVNPVLYIVSPPIIIQKLVGLK